MLKKTDVNTMPAEVVTDFLKTTLLFGELEDDLLLKLARQCVIDFYPKGTLIFKQNETEVFYLYLIQKGGVKIFMRDRDGNTTLKDFRGEGEYFGALPIIQGSTIANLNVETVEDTFCFLFPREAFQKLIRSEPRLAQRFLKSLSDKLVHTVYAELRHHGNVQRTESALYLFSAKVADIIKRELNSIDRLGSVQEAAKIMTERHIGSLLVRDESDAIIGIVTDKDLRTKVVAYGLDYSTPVSSIMSSPVHSIGAHAVCFDALLKMMSSRIHHLAVERDGTIFGMVTTHDIMVLQGTSPLYLFREIMAQRRIENIYPLSQKIPSVIRGLIEEGAKANNVTRMIAILNDHILDRLLTLQIEELGKPPVDFCWMLLGSEGRREQTFRTDQDNALIYEQPSDENKRAEAADYFRALSEKMIEHLVACGYPRCPGDIMASNPKWRQPVRVWQQYFSNWITSPDPQEVRNASIFFDFRFGFGNRKLVDELRSYLSREACKQEIFLRHLAVDCLQARPPLSFFRNFIVEKDGEHKNRLDLKKRGMLPFVDFGRLMALRHGIDETNTLVRLQLLAERGHITKDLYADAMAAYEFLMHLRLIHQLRQIDQGEQPDNYIDPGQLSDLEKQTLKEAFGVVHRLQNSVKLEYHIGDLGV